MVMERMGFHGIRRFFSFYQQQASNGPGLEKGSELGSWSENGQKTKPGWIRIRGMPPVMSSRSARWYPDNRKPSQ